MHECVVPGCKADGRNKLGVRCRVWHHDESPIAGKGYSDALWSPDADAYVCDRHGLEGAHVTLLFEPNSSKEIAVKVLAVAATEERTTEIRQ